MQSFAESQDGEGMMGMGRGRGVGNKERWEIVQENRRLDRGPLLAFRATFCC